MITLIRLEQTCTACPSQWDAHDSENNYYYIRYRWGTLTVSKNSILDNTIFSLSIGDGLDGTMSTEMMLDITGFKFEGEVADSGRL